MSIAELNARKKERSSDNLRSEENGLDGIDAAILRELCADARIPRAELSRRVGLSAPSVADRVRRLEDVGIITGYGARIDPARLGYGLTILIRARPLPVMNSVDHNGIDPAPVPW